MARRHKPQPEPQPRRPTRSPKVALDQAAKQVAENVAKAYARPKKGKPPATDPAAQALDAEMTGRVTKGTITPRPQQEPVETTQEGIIYGGKCHRCEQPISIHIKPIEGTYQLMNFYSVRCVCKGTVSIHKIGRHDHTEFEHLDPNHPSNARIESIDGVGKEQGK